MNLEKLKDTARKFEQKEDWRKAIEVYLKAIQQIESGTETAPDLSLYNRVGDLYLKINDTPSAVRSYERAVDLYADQGFFNNAIALCGKILRVNPGRTQTYLKLAQLHARKNVVIEAKRNLLEFLERMNGLGQLNEAFQSVKVFADQFSGSQDIRLMLVDLLRASSRIEEAREQLEKLAGDLEARGERTAARQTLERLHDLESSGAVVREPPPVRPGDLVFLDTGTDLPFPAGREIPIPPPLPAGSVTEPGTGESEIEAPEGLILSEPHEPRDGSEALILDPITPTAAESDWDPAAADIEFGYVPVDGLEPTTTESDPELLDGLLDVSSDDALGYADDRLLSDEPGVEESLDIELIDQEGYPETAPAVVGATAGLPIIQVPTSAEADGPTEGTRSLDDLENAILDDPEDPDRHRELADLLLSVGDVARGMEELDLALMGYEQAEDWNAAGRIVGRMLSVDPDNVLYHQKRVELAFRLGDRAPLLEAYLALGDALARSGAIDKSLAVYRRVLEHDPGNARAAAALVRHELAPEPVAGSPPERPHAPASPAPRSGGPEGASQDFIDLGSLVLEESGPRDTRMRIDRREPEDTDEQREFKEILEQFKRGIDENLDTDDYQAHYDLGVAFKEMGLLDEAIAEFQKALRAPDGRLRTSEALGIAFFDKGQFAISETVLRRAVETAEGGDEAKIGLLYWLGRAAEAQGKLEEAVTSYERALAVDIRFMDLHERLQRLAPGRRP